MKQKEEIIDKANELGYAILEKAIKGSLVVKGFKTFKDASDFASEFKGITRYFKFNPATGITEIENERSTCTNAYPDRSYLDKFNWIYAVGGFEPYKIKKKFSERKFVRKMIFEITSGYCDFNNMLFKLEGLILKYRKLYEEDVLLKGDRIVLWNDKYSHTVPREIMEFKVSHIDKSARYPERLEAYYFVGVQIKIED